MCYSIVSLFVGHGNVTPRKFWLASNGNGNPVFKLTAFDKASKIDYLVTERSFYYYDQFKRFYQERAPEHHYYVSDSLLR